ncbi:MAG: flippase [Candidatus Zhuqueibacterota bacterium]
MKKYWITSGMFSLLSNGSILVFAFLTFLVLVRILPQQEFGVWVLYLTVTTFPEILRTGITQNALVKHLEGGKAADYRKITTASFFIHCVTGLIGVGLVTALAPLLSRVWNVPDLRNVLWMYGLYSAFYIPLAFFQFLSMANLDFRSQFCSTLAFNAANFVFIVAINHFRGGLKLIEIPLVQTSAAIVGLLVIAISGGKYIKLSRAIDWQWVSRLFGYGKFVIASAFSSMLFNRMDLMMIGYFLNPTAVAIYNIPTRIGNYVDVPMNSLATVVFPQAALRVKEMGLDNVRYLYERSVGIMLAMIIPASLAMIVFAEPIVVWTAGENYRAAVPVLQLFAIMSFVKPFGRQGGTILDSIGYPNYNSYILIVGLIINFALNWIFIIHYGIMGAIVATFISTVIGTATQQILLVRLIRTKTHHPFIYMWVFYRDGFKKVIRSVSRQKTVGKKI